MSVCSPRPRLGAAANAWSVPRTAQVNGNMLAPRSSARGTLIRTRFECPQHWCRLRGRLWPERLRQDRLKRPRRERLKRERRNSITERGRQAAPKRELLTGRVELDRKRSTTGCTSLRMHAERRFLLRRLRVQSSELLRKL